MITPEKKRLIRETLKCLAASHSAAVVQYEETIAVLSHALELDRFDSENDDQSPSHLTSAQGVTREVPVADRRTFTIIWRGRSCFLGNTLPFRLFERLARSPNRYVPHVDLLDDVWDGQRVDSTIRGVAKRLRDQLTRHGMDDLAQAVDGSNSGHYGLMLV